MGLRGDAAIAGYVELKPEKKPQGEPLFCIEQWARLAQLALQDAGIEKHEVDGLVTSAIAESAMFAPATLAEYLGLEVNFAEHVDLGGASSAGAIWRAAAAIELGIAEVVVCAFPAGPMPMPPELKPHPFPFGASSNEYGSPQAQFDIPYGNLAQNCGYAQIANLYAARYGYDPRALAKIAADQRASACANPDAIFYGQPLSIDDVLNSPMIADPIHLLEIVMPVAGGAAVVVTSKERAARARHRPVRITGCGERLAFKTPTYAPDLLHTPIAAASAQAFAMAGVSHADIDMASIYDCYTITVLMTLEDAGFCPKGKAAEFIHSHDLSYRGDFPCNPHGGQLSFGQTGMAGGMHHVIDGARQIMGRAGGNQVKHCNRAFVTGNGGIMSEQVVLILEGA
ncbi:transporter [Denitratisoma sp. DHT3]|uniref:thiolase family protein n=1 Tax=Denitratisoma sp. DHT3 TaxID=1981880 RepID=UPI001198A97E|nr:thiolase family protein [Denitratisoma sp. DHT3]QDX81240.1 transporter [Denitratisoma sp. DHT3]